LQLCGKISVELLTLCPLVIIALEHAEAAAKRALVEQFQAKRSADEADARRRTAIEKDIEAKRIKDALEAAKPRLEARAQLLVEKEHNRRQKEVELEEQENRKIELLKKLAEQVRLTVAGTHFEI
jgi:hypothetical protein